MKVTCQSCQAKYTIADEKVRGKVAKIRCKKCGTTIIVNGTDSSSAAVVEYAQQGAADDQWSILVADGDQRTMTTSQVAEHFAAGTISLETPAWKDGMADWLPISQIDALRSAVEQGAGSAADAALMNASLLPNASMLPDIGSAPAVMSAEPLAAKVPSPAARIQAPEPAARRRPRGGSTDLFGAAQDDVMTSAAVDPTPHSPSQDKPTGARNENSVLFSLASLTGGGPAAPAAKPSASADRAPPSSKADLRALMTGAENRPPPQKSKLDDIINLSGGGVYSPAMLTAPILAPPVDSPTAATSMDGVAPKPKGKGMIIAAVAGVLLIGGGAVAFMGGKSDSDKAMAAASASAKAAAEALAAAVASAAEPAPVAPAEPTTAEAPAQAPTVLAPGQAAPKAEPEKKVVAARAEKAEKPDKPAGPSGPIGAAALGVPPPAAPAPAPAPAAAGGEFDRAAALSALSAAATAAQSCKKSDGPTGSGRIAVTFANNGQATTANVEGPPFSGTPVGGCIAARFRGVRVPPFGGGTVTVKKTFFIN